MSTRDPDAARTVTVRTLAEFKREGRKFACLTAYDATFSRILDEAGVDIILVGDSLGMVVQGLDTTIPVSMDDMAYHTRLVARGCQRALLMVDMPFMSFSTTEQALRNARRLMQEGMAHMVKLEGGDMELETVTQLSRRGVPVCAHIGLQPQSVHQLGGYRVQGREASAAEAMLNEARKLEDAGASVLLLECVPSTLAQQITEGVQIPVIGIGAGPHCDGQVLVLYDMLGITPGKRLRFTKDFLLEAGHVQEAITRYVREVKDGVFPGPEHGFE